MGRKDLIHFQGDLRAGPQGLAMVRGKKPEKVGLLVNAMMAGLAYVHVSLLAGAKLGATYHDRHRQ